MAVEATDRLVSFEMCVGFRCSRQPLGPSGKIIAEGLLYILLVIASGEPEIELITELTRRRASWLERFDGI